MRNRKRFEINPGHGGIRGVLRVVGPIIALIGFGLLATGLVDFFSAAAGGGFPTRFWMAMAGIPMFAVGMQLTGVGYAGAIARYFAQEHAPVAADTFGYVARETRDDVRSLSGARCPACGTVNDAAARYCDECGAALPIEKVCLSCGEKNDADARFCDSCGAPLDA